MSEYTALIKWEREGAAFTDNRFSRVHRWSFDGGTEVPASASPHVVSHPLSVAAAVDPEEAFVAAWSRSCLVECLTDKLLGPILTLPHPL